MTIKTDEFRTTLIDSLVSPAELAEQIPLDDETANFIIKSRKDIEAIIKGDDKRLLVIIGPCSIHMISACWLLLALVQFMIQKPQLTTQKN